MKIIQALGWFYPHSLGGTEVYVEGLCQRLQARGHDVWVAAPDSKAILEYTYTHRGLRVYRYPITAEPTRAETQGLLRTRGSEAFHLWLRKQKPDVVHFHSFVTGLGINEVKIARRLGSRVIVTTHSGSLGYICQRGTMMRWGAHPCDGICESAKCAACTLQGRGLPSSLARAFGSISPTTSKRFLSLPGRMGTVLGMSSLIADNQRKQEEMIDCVDKFVVLTEWARKTTLVNGAPPHKVHLNRLGLSQRVVKKKPEANEEPTKHPIKIGYLGRFDVIKGVFDLARALLSLPKEIPVHLEFRGPVKTKLEMATLMKLKESLVDDQRVSFGDAVAESETLDILAGYDVLCCPSICLEGGPTVAIEAHAVGTPVIGTRIGGLAELVTDGINGKLVEAGDWRSLAELIREMAEDPSNTIDQWRTVLPSARTMDEIAEEYLLLYKAG